jgi:hypothetical protein
MVQDLDLFVAVCLLIVGSSRSRFARLASMMGWVSGLHVVAQDLC